VRTASWKRAFLCAAFKLGIASSQLADQLTLPGNVQISGPAASHQTLVSARLWR